MDVKLMMMMRMKRKKNLERMCESGQGFTWSQTGNGQELRLCGGA